MAAMRPHLKDEKGISQNECHIIQYGFKRLMLKLFCSPFSTSPMTIMQA
jgi:hypothetical protein